VAIDQDIGVMEHTETPTWPVAYRKQGR
jgi:hypothetical protein